MLNDLPPQELRLAVVMTGGVSLAIWMGGVASEIDQLRRACDLDKKDRTPEQQVYAELLKLSNYQPRVDVVSGTSAGGVNGALLAGAVARRKTLEGLRDIWLKVADFSELLRSPFDKDQPSLLKGDEYFTPGLQQGIERILGPEPIAKKRGEHPVELLVTTTLLNAEDSGLVDSYGTRIPDVRHNGLFRFDRDRLMTDEHIVSRLALAARSSASFPVAFEPSWVPCNPKSADDDHPDMRGIADFHADHFAIDGGVLVNRPIEPALRSMFAMEADNTDVCRVLLYVVPDPGETLKAGMEEQDNPFDLTDVGLKSLVNIPRTQSIARDLERLNEHNALVEAQRDARDFILDRCFENQLSDVETLLGAYCERRADREVEWLLGELTLRDPATMEQELGFDPIKRGDLARDLAELRVKSLPTAMPRAKPTVWQVAPWGIDSLDRAATVALDLARRGWGLADPGDIRKDLADARKLAHDALEELRERRRERRAELRGKKEDETLEAWTVEMLGLMRSDDDELLATALIIAGALRDAADAIRRLAAEQPTDEAPKRLAELSTRLAPDATVSDGECLRRLFSLEVIQGALGITTPVVEQQVKLLQLSANTRDGISNMKSAAQKLTGMRLVHFAAFYKPSWRANDWMWGRLDAAGWLTQLVLEPSRLKDLVKGKDEPVELAFGEIRRIALGPGGAEHEWLKKQFEKDEDDLKDELAWLTEDDPTLPPALPRCSMAVARRIQLSILAQELPAIATAVELDEANQALSQSGRDFRAEWTNVGPNPGPEKLSAGLRACEFAAEGFLEEYDSGLLARSATGAAAIATSALAGSRSGLPGLVGKSKIMTGARGLSLALHGVVDAALRRSKFAFAIIIGLTAVAGGALGVAAALDGTQPGLTSFGFAVVFAAWVVGLWRSPKILPTRQDRVAPDAMKPPKQHWFKWLLRYARYLLLTFVTLVICAGIARIPWALGEWIDPCPKEGGKATDCFQGDVEEFITGLEPAFIVIAVVVGAVVFGWQAASPRATKPPEKKRAQTAD